MAEQIKLNSISFRKILAASPKIVLLLLALLNLFAVPAMNGHFCFHNWSSEFYAAFLIVIAVGCLWFNKSWSYLVAILACCWALYDFCYTALLFFGFLPVRPDSDASELTPEVWLNIMRHHPEEFTHAILATVVLVVVACYFVRSLLQKRRVFK